MKGIVVEIEKEHAIILNSNGEFLKIKNSGNLTIGYEVDVPSKTFNFKKFKTIASAAAIFLMVFGLSIVFYNYFTPYSYVSVDINPSMEITLNTFDKVIDVNAINNEGEKLLENTSYKSKNLEDVLDSIFYIASEKGYVSADTENTIMIAVSSKSKKEISEVSENITTLTKEMFKSKNLNSEIIVENTSVEKREEAKEKGVSQGKLFLMDTLKVFDPEMVSDDFKDIPVKEMVNIINKSSGEIDPVNTTNENKKSLPNNKVQPPKKDDIQQINPSQSKEDDSSSNTNSNNNNSRNDNRNPNNNSARPNISSDFTAGKSGNNPFSDDHTTNNGNVPNSIHSRNNEEDIQNIPEQNRSDNVPAKVNPNNIQYKVKNNKPEIKNEDKQDEEKQSEDEKEKEEKDNNSNGKPHDKMPPSSNKKH
ncbi:anti-sigma factor domain-containing protein [Herbivorax sp. ANBcel31]|uniref:anti-sigma factor domain-containing protein n=1 Tax=Herbivorax sp. ANBcel31 TaxID=3069754 RepID=UPI0027B2E7F1|nr:anti-sigma factor domain-containing protein [Herbivorax sp. ANBcel31]MDQ2086727.1 anti-sigma factor domain-containing protein [Herbivorax sp. ANBcel31]